jgi:hypothetical protein
MNFSGDDGCLYLLFIWIDLSNPLYIALNQKQMLEWLILVLSMTR